MADLEECPDCRSVLNVNRSGLVTKLKKPLFRCSLCNRRFRKGSKPRRTSTLSDWFRAEGVVCVNCKSDNFKSAGRRTLKKSGEVHYSIRCKDCGKRCTFGFKDSNGGGVSAPQVKSRKTHPTNIYAWLRLQFSTICQGCFHDVGNPKLLCVDHVIPFLNPNGTDGEDNLSNFTLLCRACNGKKYNTMTLDELRRFNLTQDYVSPGLLEYMKENHG